MRINFKKIRLQNFLSYQKEQEYSFDGDLTLISAKNGSGKTAISDALFYALFGKNPRSKKNNDLINISTNKKLKVELEFNIKDDNYKVIRGMKPNIFEIYKNDVLIDMNSSVKEYQKQLENILQFDELIFNQLLYLGANVTNSKNFMELNSKEKEEVFQILMDTSFFNELNQKGKEYKKFLKEEIVKLDIMLENEHKNLEHFKKQYEEDKKHNELVQNQKERMIEKYKEDLYNLEDDLNNCEMMLEALEEKLRSSKYNFENIDKKYQEDLNELKLKTKEKIEIIKNEISKITKDVTYLQEQLQDKKVNIKNYQKAEKDKIICDKCGNEIKQHFDFNYDEEVKEAKRLKEQIDDKKKQIEKLNEEILQIKNNAMKEKENISKKYNINNLKNEISSLEKDISYYTNKSEDIKINIIKKKEDINNLENMTIRDLDKKPILKTEKNIDILENKIIKLKEKINLLDEFLVVISDDNLKGQFIEKHLPLLNYYINNYIIEFGLPYNFIMDKKFKEKIIYNDEELNFGQLSNGQKMRIIVAILFAFLKLSEEKAKVSFNVLILDEFINGSLDSDGIEDILKILKNNFEDKNIILITHNDDIKNSEIFDRIVKIEKTDKGSVITS